MNFIEGAYYRAIGVRKEFPELNPVSAALMRARGKLHVVRHHCVIEGYPLPQEDAAIVTGNHYSHKDPLIASHAGLSMASRLIRTVVKMSLIKRGAYESKKYLEDIGDKSEAADYSVIDAFTMRGIGVIPILRDNPESNKVAIRHCYQVLDTGQLLGIFLQASRDEEGFLRNLQVGAAHIASRPKYKDTPIHAFAFSKDRATLLEPFTYNQLRNQYEREIGLAELTIMIADRIAAALPERVREDWQTRRQFEVARLNPEKNRPSKV